MGFPEVLFPTGLFYLWFISEEAFGQQPPEYFIHFYFLFSPAYVVERRAVKSGKKISSAVDLLVACCGFTGCKGTLRG